MRLDKAYLLDKISLLATFVKRFRFILVFAVFSIMYGYILTQVNTIEAQRPSAKKISEQTTVAPQTKVDPELAQKITSLEEQNVQIRTLFNQARENPFAE